MPRNESNLSDYQALAEFRYQIRRFLRFSENAARESGLEPQQYQLILAVKGMPDGTQATVGEVAERLQLQHHSTVELLDRMVQRGLVSRKRGSEDRRQVVVQLTAKGERLLRDLALHHREQLREQAPVLVSSLKGLIATFDSGRGAAKKRSRVAKAEG